MELKQRIHRAHCAFSGCKNVLHLVEVQWPARLDHIEVCPAHLFALPSIGAKIVKRDVFQGATESETIRTEVKVSKQDLELARTQASQDVLELKDFSIQTNEDKEVVGGLLKVTKEQLKHLEDEQKKVLGPLKDAEKAVRALFGPALTALQHFEGALKGKLIAWENLLEETRRKATAELSRQNASTLEVTTALQTLSEAESTKTKGVTVRETADFEIVDVDQIPRQFMVPDLVAIRRATLAGVAIPGVLKTVKKIASVRV